MLAGKRLELLKETVPKLSRVAVLWDPQASSTLERKESQLPARELGLQLTMEVKAPTNSRARSKRRLRRVVVSRRDAERVGQF